LGLALWRFADGKLSDLFCFRQEGIAPPQRAKPNPKVESVVYVTASAIVIKAYF